MKRAVFRFVATCLLVSRCSLAVGQWEMHVVDNTSRGADGVRLADFDRDGRPDIVTGWEEGGVIRVYQNPGPAAVKKSWPRVTVGRVRSPEDAVFVDLDSDGFLDVVSCCEGTNQTVFVHWAPAEPADYLDEGSWKTEAIPATRGHAAWMFALPLEVDHQRGTDLVLGAKGSGGCVAWLESPDNPRQVDQWKLHVVEKAGWIMSLRAVALEGRTRLLVSDRKGKDRGVFFLSPRREAAAIHWKRTNVLDDPLEYMFLDVVPIEDGARICVATRNGKIIQVDVANRLEKSGQRAFNNPEGIEFGKGVAIGDIDLDGQVDLVHTTNTQTVSRNRSVAGVHWIRLADGVEKTFPISGVEGKKYDRIELVDLDGDGDLDVLTCEEAANLGVIWFENPTRK